MFDLQRGCGISNQFHEKNQNPDLKTSEKMEMEMELWLDPLGIFSCRFPGLKFLWMEL